MIHSLASKIFVTAGIFLGTSFLAFAAIPSPAHDALTKAIDRSVEWSGHVKIEVAKGKKLEPKHLKQEIASLRSWLSEMTKSSGELVQKYPYEKDEGHFIALLKHQANATEFLSRIEASLDTKNPDFGAMKKMAKSMGSEIDLAAREHRLELHEIEIQ